MLAGRALSAAVTGEAVPDDGGVIGVFYPDEPDGQGLTAKTMPTIDPGTGVRFLTLTNHFYSGAAPLAQGRGIYPGLIAKADMIGFDLYPLQVWCRPERLVDVYLAQRELVSLAKGKPTFQWIEAAGMACPDGPPTRDNSFAHFLSGEWALPVGNGPRRPIATGDALLAPAVGADTGTAGANTRDGVQIQPFAERSAMQRR